MVGEQATVQLNQVRASELATLLGSGQTPLEVHLQRDAAANPPSWSGSMVYRLPAGKPASP